MFHDMLHKKRLFRGISIFLILFMLREGMLGTGVSSPSPVENLNSHMLAPLSFFGQLQLAARGSEQEWIQAVRSAALEFAQSIKHLRKKRSEFRDLVAKFLKTVERNHNRPIPIQIATRASNFALMDEMEAFLQSEIEFALASGETEQEEIYRIALFELLITRFHSPFLGKNDRAVLREEEMQKLIRRVILPSLSEDIYKGGKRPDESLPLWVAAYRSFLSGRKEIFGEERGPQSQEMDKQVKRFLGRLEGYYNVNYPLPIHYPFGPKGLISMQIIHIGIRAIVSGIHRWQDSEEGIPLEGIIDDFLNFRMKLILEKFFSNNLEEIIRHIILAKEYLDKFVFFTTPEEEPGRGLFYRVIDNHFKKVYKVSLPYDGETLLDYKIHADLTDEIKPQSNTRLSTKGNFTHLGEIELNPELHDNTLHLLSTWAHELFHLRWIYTIKSQPGMIAEWTQRALKNREVWEKIEETFLKLYGVDPDVRIEWFISPTQRRVNEILALLFGYMILHTAQKGELPRMIMQEFDQLQEQFGLSPEFVITPRMQVELDYFQPLKELIESEPELDRLVRQVISVPLSEIKKLDGSLTEADLPICDRMALGEYLAQQKITTLEQEFKNRNLIETAI